MSKLHHNLNGGMQFFVDGCYARASPLQHKDKVPAEGAVGELGNNQDRLPPECNN